MYVPKDHTPYMCYRNKRRKRKRKRMRRRRRRRRRRRKRRRRRRDVQGDVNENECVSGGLTGCVC